MPGPYDAEAYRSPKMRSSTSSRMISSTTPTMDSRPMPATVPALAAEVASLKAENESLCIKLEDTRDELEMYQRALSDDAALRLEVGTLREFIGDVRLGIRDLSEYEDICG